MPLYRAFDSLTPDPVQRPQSFVMKRPPWFAIRSASEPVRMAVLRTQLAINAGAQGLDRGWAYKCMVEWAYEVVRLHQAIEAPSRLRSVFCFGEADDAVRFAEETGKVSVFAVEPVEGFLTGDFDFGLYYVEPGDLDVNVQSFGEAWSRACALAEGYWSGEKSVGPMETLVDGELTLGAAVWTVS